MSFRDPHAVAMGAAVRGAIASADLSQAEAAAKVPLSINSFSRRILGEIPFTWPEIVRVAEMTGTTAPELATAAERIAVRIAA